jgi:hypothetical protein
MCVENDAFDSPLSQSADHKQVRQQAVLGINMRFAVGRGQWEHNVDDSCHVIRLDFTNGLTLDFQAMMRDSTIAHSH